MLHTCVALQLVKLCGKKACPKISSHDQNAQSVVQITSNSEIIENIKKSYEVKCEMHFPTLPRRWRVTTTETFHTKPPKSVRRYSTQSRRSSISGDSRTTHPFLSQAILPSAGEAVTVTIFRPPKPQLELMRREPDSKLDLSSFTKDWKSKSLTDLPNQVNSISKFNIQQQQPLSSFRTTSTTSLGHANIVKTNLRSNSWRNLNLLASPDGKFK